MELTEKVWYLNFLLPQQALKLGFVQSGKPSLDQLQKP